MAEGPAACMAPYLGTHVATEAAGYRVQSGRLVDKRVQAAGGGWWVQRVSAGSLRNSPLALLTNRVPEGRMASFAPARGSANATLNFLFESAAATSTVDCCTFVSLAAQPARICRTA